MDCSKTRMLPYLNCNSIKDYHGIWSKSLQSLAGDVDQLPPVGPGTVLSAAIDSKAIPVVDLRDIFRQAHQSGIVKAAHSVQRGSFPALTEISPDLLQVSCVNASSPF